MNERAGEKSRLKCSRFEVEELVSMSGTEDVRVCVCRVTRDENKWGLGKIRGRTGKKKIIDIICSSQNNREKELQFFCRGRIPHTYFF